MRAAHKSAVQTSGTTQYTLGEGATSLLQVHTQAQHDFSAADANIDDVAAQRTDGQAFQHIAKEKLVYVRDEPAS